MTNLTSITTAGFILLALCCEQTQAIDHKELDSLAGHIYLVEGAALRHKADAGNAEARFQLGNLYYDPPPQSGITHNLQRAFFWYEKAAFQNHAGAQHNLAQLYLLGDGIERNEVLAYVWMTVAADNGYPAAVRNIDILSRDFSNDVLSSAQKQVRDIKNRIRNRTNPSSASTPLP